MPDTMISTTDPASPAEPVPAPPTGRRVIVTFLVALIAFFCMGAGWATALPPNGTYDEGQHIYRAYGVATGQLYASTGIQRVPRSLVPAQLNCTWALRKSASCQTPTSHDSSLEGRVSTAAAYSPVYYLPVGLPMVAFKDHTGLLLGRYVSMLMAALALAGALAIAVALRLRLMVAGVLLVATPMTINLASSINPNGLEIACGVLLWAAMLGLVRAPRWTPDGEAVDGLSEKLTHRLVVVAAVSGSLLMTIRYLGPLLLALILVTAALFARPGRVRELLRRRDVRITGTVLAAAFVIAVAWILTSNSADIADTQGRRQHLGLGRIGQMILVLRMPFWLNQMVGQFSYGETVMPAWVIVSWYVLVSALVVPALLMAGRRLRWSAVGLGAVCLAILVALEVHFVNTVGWVSHGRYVMPAGAGLVLVGAFVGRWRAALGEAGSARLARLVVLVTLPIHLWALGAVMTRFQAGPTAFFNPLHGYLHHDPNGWLPPGGPVPPLVLEAIGLITLGILGWRLVRWPDRSPAVAG